MELQRVSVTQDLSFIQQIGDYTQPSISITLPSQQLYHLELQGRPGVPLHSQNAIIMPCRARHLGISTTKIEENSNTSKIIDSI